MRWIVPFKGGRWDDRIVESSGVYAVRDRTSHEVLYVGMSATDRLKYTLSRKFQEWDRSPARGERGHRGSMLLGDPTRVEVRIWYCARDEAHDLERKKRCSLWPTLNPPLPEDCTTSGLVPF